MPTLLTVGSEEPIGSLPMTLLAGRVHDGHVAIDGYPAHWPLPVLGLGAVGEGTALTVGFWPDDIVLATAEAPGFVATTVWATNFHGKDQAVEVHFGPSRMRKVVRRTKLGARRPVLLAPDPAKAFVFASPSGERLRPRGVAVSRSEA